MKSKKHLDNVRQLQCCITGQYGVEAHHIKGAGLTGTGQKCSDMFVIPLTPELHREFHTNGRSFWEMRYGTQADHLAATLHKMLYQDDRYGLLLARNNVLAGRVRDLENELALLRRKIA